MVHVHGQWSHCGVTRFQTAAENVWKINPDDVESIVSYVTEHDIDLRAIRIYQSFGSGLYDVYSPTGRDRRNYFSVLDLQPPFVNRACEKPQARLRRCTIW